MTTEELHQLRALRREIRLDTERLLELETRATHITAELRGAPSDSGDGKALERQAAAIADLRTLIEQKRARCDSELLRLERFIETVPDSLTRQILSLRFADGLTWQQVANRIGCNTADGVRKTALRYLENAENLSVLSASNVLN